MSKKIYIDYEQLVQSALRSVVKEALTQAAKKGLSGNHHFYIAFATDHPGIDIPDYLKEQYHDEITIVLQHEYCDQFHKANEQLHYKNHFCLFHLYHIH